MPSSPCLHCLLCRRVQHGMGLYEGASLGMAVRKAGHEVLLQPLALAAYSRQGAGPGWAGRCGEEADRTRFVARWKEVLQARGGVYMYAMQEEGCM